MELEVAVTPGLGDNSYVLSSADQALVVDPQRDAGRFLALAEASGARVAMVLETHVHNDYLTGALEIRAATGAEIVAPAAGGYGFGHRPAADGDRLELGELALTAMETPGHTPEHLSYLVEERGRPVAVFTGGSLMVQGAGRTDLLGPAMAEGLTRAQFRTLRRLAALPDEVAVLPTHGPGSFCGAGPAPGNRTSTIGEERRTNPALLAPDEDAFARRQLSGLLAYPAYYAHMAPINRAGPAPSGAVSVPLPLPPDRVAAALEAGTAVVDGRWRVAFARTHIPGSINIELQDDFATYAGWVLPFNAPMVLVLPDPEEEALPEAVTQLMRIGYERVQGWLAGGMEAWRASGRPVGSYPVAGLEEWCRGWRGGRRRVLDVRQRVEWEGGHVPGSRHAFVGDLPGLDPPIDRGEEELWVACASGHRASLASSLLARSGVPVHLVEGTGVQDFLTHCLGREGAGQGT